MRVGIVCPRCGGLSGVNASGALVLHTRYVTLGSRRCEGSGHQVTAADVVAWREREITRAREAVERCEVAARVAAERLAAAQAELPATLRAIDRAAARVRT